MCVCIMDGWMDKSQSLQIFISFMIKKNKQLTKPIPTTPKTPRKTIKPPNPPKKQFLTNIQS